MRPPGYPLVAAVGLHRKLVKRKRTFAEAPSETAKRHQGVAICWRARRLDYRKCWPRHAGVRFRLPHPEGTGNPIAKFERAMENCDQATMDKFYHGNMLEVMSVA